MSSLAHITIHHSQFPDQVRRDLLESLRTRQVNHKFHYDSVKQTQKWLALHGAYSPSRTDPDCAAIYDQSFAAAVSRIPELLVQLIGLGCGGGQKDTRLLSLLRKAGREVFYTPSDVSTAMVLVARQAALAVVPDENCFPLVCDLAAADDLGLALEETEQPGAARLITFFGMIPNFEPQVILPRLAGLMRPKDWLLFSANLAPGPDYAAGVQRILPLYDNELTRDWLLTLLLDLGVDRGDGDIRFRSEEEPAGGGLRRVAAYFHFNRSRELQLDQEGFEFSAGEAIRLFFSYRHTPALVRQLLGQHGLNVVEQSITASEEEGVFLVARAR
jgi:L-histidine Nalpha-methyltransferase